jgi:phage anti-repressor protein
MSQLLTQYNKTDEPEIEIIQEPYLLEIEIIQAIRMIQKNDRGRQGRARIADGLKLIKQSMLTDFKQNQIRQGNNIDNANK